MIADLPPRALFDSYGRATGPHCIWTRLFRNSSALPLKPGQSGGPRHGGSAAAQDLRLPRRRPSPRPEVLVFSTLPCSRMVCMQAPQTEITNGMISTRCLVSTHSQSCSTPFGPRSRTQPPSTPAAPSWPPGRLSTAPAHDGVAHSGEHHNVVVVVSPFTHVVAIHARTPQRRRRNARRTRWSGSPRCAVALLRLPFRLPATRTRPPRSSPTRGNVFRGQQSCPRRRSRS